MVHIRKLAAFAAAVLATVALGLPAHAIDIQQVTSPLGIRAWLVEDNSIPLFSMDYAFSGGSSQEPADKRGIANMLVSLLDEGAGDLDSTAFQSKLEDQSISMGFNSDRDSISGSLRAITDDRDEAVHLLNIALTSPRFDQEPVDRIRSSILRGISNRDRNQSQQASVQFNAALFPGHIYGVPEGGTADSVNSITVADLRAFQSQVMARDNLKIAVVGDIDPQTLGTMIDQIFGTLPAKANLVPVPAAPPPMAKLINVAVPNAAQTSLRFAGAAPLRADPDYLAAYLASFILGAGNPGTRLYDQVRVQRGLTYSIDLGLDSADHAGWFIGTTSTRADQADEVLQLVQTVIKQYADQGPTADELAAAKAYLIGSYPLRFVTTGQEASQLLGVLTDNLGIDYINRRNDLIAAVSLDDVKREAKTLFGGDMLISRVGPPPS